MKAAAIDGSGDIVKLADAPAPASGTITKTLRISAADFIPSDSTVTWASALQGSIKTPGTANAYATFTKAVPLPPGVTVTQVLAHLYKDAAHDIASVGVWRITGDAAAAQIFSCGLGATGAWTDVTDSTTPETLSAIYRYAIYVTLRGVDAVADARFAFVELTYTMPDFGKTL